jgi:hypothetical protein
MKSCKDSKRVVIEKGERHRWFCDHSFHSLSRRVCCSFVPPCPVPGAIPIPKVKNRERAKGKGKEKKNWERGDKGMAEALSPTYHVCGKERS